MEPLRNAESKFFYLGVQKTLIPLQLHFSFRLCNLALNVDNMESIVT